MPLECIIYNYHTLIASLARTWKNMLVLRHLMLSTKYPFFWFVTCFWRLCVIKLLFSLIQFKHVLMSENLLLLNSRYSWGCSFTDFSFATIKYWIDFLFDFSVRSFSRFLISSSCNLEKLFEGWSVVAQPLKARSAKKTMNINWFCKLNPFLLSLNLTSGCSKILHC